MSRAAILLFLVDPLAQDRDPETDVEVLAAELEAFDPELASRPRLVVVTKADAAPERAAEVAAGHPGALVISAVSGEGMEELVELLRERVREARAATPARVGYVRHVVKESPLEVAREDAAWRVSGRRAERAVATTDMENDEAVELLQRRLIAMGVERMLAAAGAVRGDEVRIGEAAFDFEPEGEPTGVVDEGVET